MEGIQNLLPLIIAQLNLCFSFLVYQLGVGFGEVRAADNKVDFLGHVLSYVPNTILGQFYL